MNDINACGNHESLVTYLYDECEPAERQSMAAHVAVCASCAEELQALRDARVHLAAWSPPALPLGFQMTRMDGDQPANVLRPAAWWRQPLPAWAQVAAAAVIFAAGMGLGAARSDTPASSPAVAVTPVAVGGASVANTISRDELRRLETRLRTLESATQVQRRRTVSGSIDEEALLRRVTETVDARIRMSEQENIRVLASAGRSLEDYRAEQAARMEEIEREQEDIRQAVSRGLGSYQVVRAASLSNTGR